MVLGRIIVDSLMGSNMEKAYTIADSDIHVICLLIELETAVQYKLFLTLKHIQQLGDLQRLNYCWCECAFRALMDVYFLTACFCEHHCEVQKTSRLYTDEMEYDKRSHKGLAFKFSPMWNSWNHTQHSVPLTSALRGKEIWWKVVLSGLVLQHNGVIVPFFIKNDTFMMWFIALICFHSGMWEKGFMV